MELLSQGRWIQVVGPEQLREDIKKELEEVKFLYKEL